MKKSVFVIVALCFINSHLLAYVGETSADFLNLSVGARAIAMGGAVTSLTSGVHSLFWNPGGLGWLDGSELSFTHTEHFQSIRYENIGFAYGRNTMGVGFSMKGLYLSGIEERTGPSEEPLSIMNAYFVVPSLSIAKSMSGFFSLGINTKLVFQQIGEDKASSFATDAGVSIRSGIKGLKFGFSISDLGTKVRFLNESYPLPSQIRSGIAYSPLNEKISVAFDIVKPFKEKLKYCIGFEGTIMERFSLRTGFRTGLGQTGNTDNLAGLSAGAGFKVMDIDIDYAFSSYGVIGPSHTFSVSYIFGRSKGIRMEEEKRIAVELEKRSRMTAQTFYHLGIEKEKEGKYEDALKSFDIALIWDPAFKEASNHIQTLTKKIKKKEINEHLTKGIAEFKNSNYMESISEFGLVLKLDPTNALAKQWLDSATEALVSSQIKKIRHEKVAREKITKHFKAGLSYFSKRNYSRAIKEWNIVLSLDPTHTQASEYIAKARVKIKEEITKGLEKINQYINQEKWFLALYKADYILKIDPKNKEALQRRSTIRKKMTNLSKQHTKKGIKLFNQGKYNSAGTEFEIALDFNNKNITAKQYLSKIKSRKKKKISGADVNELYLKGIDAYTNEKFRLAISYWERVLEIDPNHSNAKENILRAKKKLKVYEKLKI